MLLLLPPELMFPADAALPKVGSEVTALEMGDLYTNVCDALCKSEAAAVEACFMLLSFKLA